MAEMLFELSSEEIPARFQADAARTLLRSLEDRLRAANLGYDQAEACYGPRRLTFSVRGLPRQQPDQTEERKGPKEGAPTQALEGFLRGAGLKSLDEAELRETRKGRVWFAVTHKTGLETRVLLPALLRSVIEGHRWPKSQRWARTTFRWVRPLKRILAVFDGRVLDGELDLGGGHALAFTAQAEGHRFLGSGPFEAHTLGELEGKLEQQFCLLRARDRKARIQQELQALCQRANLTLIEDPALLEEVAGLAEWPRVVQGQFDPAFLSLPEECLILSMKVHQKYFAARVAPPPAQASGQASDQTSARQPLANVFFAVANSELAGGSHVIQSGNERVLNARLSDAKFFYDQDLAQPLEAALPKLDALVFHAKLGSVGAKVQRMIALAKSLAEILDTDAALAERAVTLMKADLVSAMVYEFPELQGLMGQNYAAAAGEDPAVAAAIAAHYQPAGPDDACPSEPLSIIAALADKIDTLVGFWLIDQRPTGSKDPFALRRAALGVVRLIRENALTLDLPAVFAAHAARYGLPGDISQSLSDFIFERLAVQLRDQGVPADVVQAVRGGAAETDVNRFVIRAQTTQARLSADLIAAYKRAANILDKSGAVDPAAARPTAVEADRTFSAALDAARARIAAFMDAKDFGQVFDTLAGLRADLDQYFDAVMIKAPDPEVRRQRLSLLADFVAAVDQVADLSKLEG